MYDVLFDYIEAKAGEGLPEHEREVIMAAFDQKCLRRRQHFLQEGDVCKHIGFIVKGSARMFSVDEKGHEHIIHFGLESWWISDPESFLHLMPSQKRIHAAIGMSAEERYLDLSTSHPQFLHRFPMNMIASYLGVSPETLSRIRRSATRK